VLGIGLYLLLSALHRTSNCELHSLARSNSSRGGFKEFAKYCGLGERPGVGDETSRDDPIRTSETGEAHFYIYSKTEH
jgi:hypothetical protein